MRLRKTGLFGLALIMTLFGLAGCGGGSGGGGGNTGSPPPPGTYTIGGSVTGLAGATGLVLQVNRGSDLPIAADGAFTFATSFDNLSAYEVKVLTEPTATPALDCAVNDGIGRVTGASVTDIRVICSPIVDLYAANDEVTAIALSDDGSTLYLGGEFTNLGPPAATFVTIDRVTGEVTGMPGDIFGARALVAAPDGNGGWYVGGYYDDRGIYPDSLLHVLPDGSIDSDWSPSPDGAVTEMAVSGSTLYVAGNFSTIDGQSRSRLAAIDMTTGRVTAWDPSPNAPVRSLLVSGNTLYVGGSFGAASSQTRQGIAAFDIPTGQLTAWDPTVIGTVHSIAASGGIVYVGGTVSAVGAQRIYGGLPREGLAAIDAVTGEATNWAPMVDEFSLYGGDASVEDIIVDGNTVFVGGTFAEIDGQTRNGLAAIDATTGALTAWNPDVSGYVRSMALSGGAIYVTGYFDAIGDQRRDYLAAVDVATGQATAWDPTANDKGWFIDVYGDTVYVGGDYTSVGGASRDRLAAIDTATGTLTAWNPGADERVEALTVSGDTVYVGGDFTTVGGQPRSRLASIDAATGVVNPWAPDADDTVLSIAVDGDTVYAGGKFSMVGGQIRSRLAAIDSTSGLVSSWDPNADDWVYAIAASGATVYVGGEFNNVGGQQRTSVAALSSATGVATTWDPELIGYTFDIELAGNTVYLGTDYTSYGGEYQSIHAFDTATGEERSAISSPNLNVNSISLVGNTLYFGGFMTLGARNVITGDGTAFYERLNGDAKSIVVTESVVYAAGTFNRVVDLGGSYIFAFPR